MADYKIFWFVWKGVWNALEVPLGQHPLGRPFVRGITTWVSIVVGAIELGGVLLSPLQVNQGPLAYPLCTMTVIGGARFHAAFDKSHHELSRRIHHSWSPTSNSSFWNPLVT